MILFAKVFVFGNYMLAFDADSLFITYPFEDQFL
jgi:hypothetical protein